MGSGSPNLLRNLVRFARLARRAGMAVSAEQVDLLVRALDHVPLENRERFRDAARAVFVARREEIPIFERLFDLVFRRGAFRPRQQLDLGRTLRRLAEQQRRIARAAGGPPPEAGRNQVEADMVQTIREHSDVETLRHKDFAHLTDAELETLRRILVEQPLRLAPRRTRRYVRSAHGRSLDLRRTLRDALRLGGEPARFHRRKRRERPRPLVVLCDISGSMEIYSRIFLQLAYGLRTATDRLEVFVFGTRLTRITRELAPLDPNRALGDAMGRIADWGGGTRIGEAFRAFNYDWARRVLGQGAVVLVLSDAWDRGDPRALGAETARLA
ncbi:MAG: VWA domain-containing protein, partial [Holophagales bacterium]|nr:VWA domain-containing protein [Holophagales bacterium]